MKERKIINDLDFEVEYRLVKKKGSQKPFKELKPKKGAIIPKKDLGNIRLDFRMPKKKDMEVAFHNYIQVLSASSIQSKPEHDIYSYHLIICELNGEWGLGADDEDIQLVKPDMPGL